MGYKIKQCPVCGVAFDPTSGRQKYCKKCGPEQKEVTTKCWQVANPESNRRACARKYASNPELYKTMSSAWYAANTEKARANVKHWAGANQDKVKTNRKSWELAHPQYDKEYRANNSEIMAGCDKRHSAKRRALGFIPLNQPFEGCNGHHVDRERVVYIPEVLHMSIRHNVWNGRNMDKINAAAFDYLSKQGVV